MQRFAGTAPSCTITRAGAWSDACSARPSRPAPTARCIATRRTCVSGSGGDALGRPAHALAPSRAGDPAHDRRPPAGAGASAVAVARLQTLAAQKDAGERADSGNGGEDCGCAQPRLAKCHALNGDLPCRPSQRRRRHRPGLAEAAGSSAGARKTTAAPPGTARRRQIADAQEMRGDQQSGDDVKRNSGNHCGHSPRQSAGELRLQCGIVNTNSGESSCAC